MDEHNQPDIAGGVLSLRAAAEAIVLERAGVADPRAPVLERLLVALDAALQDFAVLGDDPVALKEAARLRQYSRWRRTIDGDPSLLLLEAAAFDHLAGDS